LRVGRDGVVAASATNEVGFSGSGGFPLGIGLYGDVFFLRSRKAGRRDCPEEEIVEREEGENKHAFNAPGTPV